MIKPSIGTGGPNVVIGDAPAEIELQDNAPITVTDASGQQIQVSLNNLVTSNSILTVNLVPPPASSSVVFESAILSVTLQDEYGNEINNFDEPVQLCFSANGKSTSNKCLNYYDEDKGEWVCTDPCLEASNDLICGFTNHFTNFAILLGGGGEDECGDDDGYTIAYLSIAFIIVAIVIVITAAVLIELKVRRSRKHLTRALSRAASRSQNSMS